MGSFLLRLHLNSLKQQSKDHSADADHAVPAVHVSHFFTTNDVFMPLLLDTVRCQNVSNGGFYLPDLNKPCFKCFCHNGRSKCRDVKRECSTKFDCDITELVIPFGDCCPVCKKNIQNQQPESGEGLSQTVRWKDVFKAPFAPQHFNQPKWPLFRCSMKLQQVIYWFSVTDRTPKN